MDGNSEVNMDTDVSSTTGDVPEIRETNMESSSQVETVIVVEELDEGTEKEMSSALAKEASQSASDNEVESCSRTPPNDEVSTNGDNAAEKSSAETFDSTESKVSPVTEEVAQTLSEPIQPKNVQEQVTTTKSSPVKNTSPMKTVECTTKPSPVKTVECEKTVDSSDNTSMVNSVTKEDGKPDIPEIAIEKKSPIKKLEMEEIQTTYIEISKASNDTSSKKEEVSVDICEQSNDSQVDSVSDVSEKEHNKSISRELKSLMKSAKESKIINECTQLTSKTRKSRAGLETSSASPSVDSDKVQGRRNSTNSQISNSSEQSEKTPLKRSMRSQNPEFVHKVKQFLNSVTGKHQRSESDDEDSEDVKKKTEPPSPKKKKQVDQVEVPEVMEGKPTFDLYCWRCHWQVEMAPNEKGHPPMYCTVCPRSFHYKCLTTSERNKIAQDKSWVCPECMTILQAETSETRSPAMKKITVGELRELLQHALQGMMQLKGVEPFMGPVDRAAFPDYDKYVVNPMDLTIIKDNVAAGAYGSTEAFIADVQWILHNSIIFNTCKNNALHAFSTCKKLVQSKLTAGARALIRTCRAEMGEIEACPECYAGAHARRPTWFVDVCSTPHILLWAKLKGFPYWPAKGMSVNNAGMVDVRFFGAHDRAWVPAKDCFLYSEKDPNSFKAKRQDIIDSMQEAEDHIRNISRKYGKFVYPPFKTPFEPTTLNEHLKAMIPSFEGELKTNYKEKANTSVTITPKQKRRSVSKSSKSSNNDGEMSDSEYNQTTKSRKMADGAEIAKEEEDSASEKDNTMEVDTPKNKEESRKRRRSALEEAVITVMDTSANSKKKRVANEGQKDNQNDNLNTSVNTSKNDNKDNRKEAKAKKTETTTSSKEASEPQSSTDKDDKVAENKTPAKTVMKVRTNKTSTPKEKDDKPATPKQKIVVEKPGTPDSAKVLRIRIDRDKSKNSPNSSQTGEKRVDRKNSDKIDAQTPKDKSSASKNKETEQNKPNHEKAKDDAKASKKVRRDLTITSVSSSPKNNGLPTISSVRSLSTVSNTSNTATPTTTNPKTIEITIEPGANSSIFTPTSTDSVKNMKEAVNKLEQLRNEKQPGFGRVGVRAFARMTSPEKPKDVEVEIKTEPMDFDDADRHSEKMDLMNVFRLRPVNPAQKLREVRINKQSAPAKVVKPPEPKPKARKTFPQPKKPDEVRSELNGKNSMVYIPIQPPTTQAPVRQVRPVAVNSSAPALRPPMPTATSTATNTVVPPMAPVVTSSATNPTPSPVVASKSNMPVGQLPTVHTVPYITSLNGQCYFSLQPIMSVGGVDNPSSAVVGEVPVPSVAPPMPVLQPSVPPATNAPPVLNGTVEPDKLPEQSSELPRLQQRPGYVNPLDANAPTTVPTPSLAGPITTKLNQHATKMTNLFRTLLEETIEKWDDPTAQLTAVKMQLETLKWRSQQEAKEMKHNFDLTVSEMRGAFEKEKARAVAEAWRSAQMEMEAALKAAKSKQWCANCMQEAQFYCCWNTSYCDYPCQRTHWPQHHAVCTQDRTQENNSSNSNTLDKRVSAPENIPALQRNTPAPTLTVGGKVVRVQGKDQPGPLSAKSSIIVSMMDEKNGIPGMKTCVGTYKAGATQVPPLILNNQMNNEEGAQKKVMTSGGYLIVGSGNNAPLVTPRRTQTIQYFQ
ncbi:protein kinase C-binding protein 1-like [Aricia agestis]|uniref:protein kinase C-binding protein 1-like n=1 Tax=Aricia agestis TaxID=91739 RepID=UPI001C209D9A|nr:protein kinase C-binding protein 1-like [Aricia agestis]